MCEIKEKSRLLHEIWEQSSRVPSVGTGLCAFVCETKQKREKGVADELLYLTQSSFPCSVNVFITTSTHSAAAVANDAFISLLLHLFIINYRSTFIHC